MGSGRSSASATREAYSFKRVPSCVVQAPGYGERPRMWLWTSCAGRSHGVSQSSVKIFGAGVASSSSCDIVSTVPASICRTVSTTASAPSIIIRSCTSPAVSFSPIDIRRFRMTSPVSTFSCKKNVVTPVSDSPFITAQLIGAAPRYLGKMEPCRLNAPFEACVYTFGGRMRYATTAITSGLSSPTASAKASSFTDSGCKMVSMPRASASFLTGVGVTFCPRPRSRSGPVTTAIGVYPASQSFFSDGTANSGVPMKRMRIRDWGLRM